MGETEKILLRSEEVQRTTSRMAHEIVEKGGSVGQIALIGIRTRGGHLVRRIAQKMESFCGTTPLVGIIDVTSYRDDLGRKERGGVPIPDEIPSSLDEKTVVLVGTKTQIQKTSSGSPSEPSRSWNNSAPQAGRSTSNYRITPFTNRRRHLAGPEPHVPKGHQAHAIATSTTPPWPAIWTRRSARF